LAVISKKIINYMVRQMFQRYSDKQRIAKIVLGTPRVDPVVLLPATRNMRQRIEKLFKKRKKRGSLTVVTQDGLQFSICHSGIGAPSTEIILNALIAGGARTVLRFDVCGSLSEDLPVGQLFLADSAHSYDGVSPIYTPEKVIAADKNLVDLIRCEIEKEQVALTTGCIATVDFFFAQTEEHHRQWAQDATAVDMETAAIYAMCQAHSVNAVSLMTVSDVKLLGHDPFSNPDFDFVGFRKGLTTLSHVIPRITKKVIEQL